MDIRKPKYIRKKDFIDYFIRNEDEWFWPLDKLTDYITNKTNKLNPEYIFDEEDDEEGNEDKSFDAYTYIKGDEFLSLEDNNPKVIEGRIIDRCAKDFIKHQYSDIKKIIDFDQTKLNNDQTFIVTKKILNEKGDFILFQPAFIYKNKAIAKPDALIRKNNKFILIEVKGTSTNKRYHLVDITYQAIIVNWLLNELSLEKIDECFLCFIKYEKCKINEISFILTPYGASTKGGSSDGENEKEKSENKIAQKNGIKIIDFLYKSLNQLLELKTTKSGKATKTHEEVCSYYKEKIVNQFDFIIDKLSEAKINLEPKFEPTIKYNDWVKKTDLFINIRDFYINDIKNDKHQLFKFSGYLILYKNVIHNYYEQQKTVNELFEDFKKGSETVKRFYHRFKNNIKYEKETLKQFNLLKSKKVYFDFETLNPAIRILDNTLPFTQVVNQVSIITDHGQGIDNKTISNNLLFDPQKINLMAYKQIIDAIIPNHENLDVSNNYSYIVYNKSFECTALKKMQELINEKTYTKKVDIICKNIYDLADFFDPRKPCFILIKELNGFYSIKKVLPYVQKNFNKIYEQVGCKNYKSELKIHNGGQAQELAGQRFFKIINDKQWNEYSEDLKKYCENDVRAMVAIEYYIKQLLN